MYLRNHGYRLFIATGCAGLGRRPYRRKHGIGGTTGTGRQPALSFLRARFTGRLHNHFSEHGLHDAKNSPAFLLTLVGVFAANGVIAEDAKIPTYGDWGRQCEKAPEGDEELLRVPERHQEGQRSAGARRAHRLSPGPGRPLIVVTAAGFAAAAGRCADDGRRRASQADVLPVRAAEGCTTVATPLNPDMIAAMKKGEQAWSAWPHPNKQVVGLPLSLNGFTKALDALKSDRRRSRPAAGDGSVAHRHDQSALVRLVAVFVKVYPLPGAEGATTLADRQGRLHRGQDRSHMRRHVVSTLAGVMV